jgi:hypothetical protein
MENSCRLLDLADTAIAGLISFQKYAD